MKRLFWLVLATALLVTGAAATFNFAVAAPPPAPTPAVMAPPAAGVHWFGDRDRRENHPIINNSIRQLRQVRFELSHGAHDFRGHRVAAMRAISEAIRQLQMANRVDHH